MWEEPAKIYQDLLRPDKQRSKLSRNCSAQPPRKRRVALQVARRKQRDYPSASISTLALNIPRSPMICPVPPGCKQSSLARWRILLPEVLQQQLQPVSRGHLRSMSGRGKSGKPQPIKSFICSQNAPLHFVGNFARQAVFISFRPSRAKDGLVVRPYLRLTMSTRLAHAGSL